MNETIEILEEYGADYKVRDGRLIVNGDLDLCSLTKIPKNFLSNTTINGGLDLDYVTTVPKEFLSSTTINGWLDLRSLKTAPKGFLSNTTIDGRLYLGALTKAHEGFLRNTTINGWLNLRSLTEVPNDFLRNTTINGDLDLRTAIKVPNDFLSSTTINGYLDLRSLPVVPEGFLSNATLNGGLDLRMLPKVPQDFLRNTAINGFLDLSSLSEAHDDFLSTTKVNGRLYLGALPEPTRELLRNNVSKLREGYNKERGYCYFDRILSKVLSVTTKNGYTIYKSPFEYIVQKGNLMAHAKTVKQGIIDLNFKIYAASVEHEELSLDDEVSVDLYRAVTGSCYKGIENWLQNNQIEYTLTDDKPVLKNNLKVADALELLEKTNAYGFKKFKKLVAGL